MITLCTVALRRLDGFIDILKQSIFKHTTLIDEVVIVRVDEPDCQKEQVIRGVNFKEIGYHAGLQERGNPTAVMCLEHALGLHRGIDEAKNDLVMICDPDVFFLSPVDKLYLDLFLSNDLHIIGVSRPEGVAHANTFFPSVINSMFRKSSLPGEDYLREYLTANHSMPEAFLQEDVALPGKILIPSNVTKMTDVWPNPTGHHETGCNLYLWAKEKNWQWLAFQTTDCHTYSTAYCRGNKKAPKLAKQNLLYHAINSTRGTPQEIEQRLINHQALWDHVD